MDRERVRNSIDIIGHQHTIGMLHSNNKQKRKNAKEKLPVIEGEHYIVLSSTLSGDYHQPTTIKWINGEVDSFTDKEKSLKNRKESKEIIKENKKNPEEFFKEYTS